MIDNARQEQRETEGKPSFWAGFLADLGYRAAVVAVVVGILSIAAPALRSAAFLDNAWIRQIVEICCVAKKF